MGYLRSGAFLLCHNLPSVTARGRQWNLVLSPAALPPQRHSPAGSPVWSGWARRGYLQHPAPQRTALRAVGLRPQSCGAGFSQSQAASFPSLQWRIRPLNLAGDRCTRGLNSQCPLIITKGSCFAFSSPFLLIFVSVPSGCG